MSWLPEKFEQRRYEIDMTHCLRNHFAAPLIGQPNQQRNARSFFEHCFLPEDMMRAKAVAVVARVHNDRIASQAASFKTFENCANASINEHNQPEITLFDAAVFVWCNSEE